MARRKKYDEAEVIEKAMHLFWSKGYEATSMQMLEKEMGINKFSIYSSFENKHGVFQESIKTYKARINSIFDQLKKSDNGVQDIKDFFYNSVSFQKDQGQQRGCLITNTYNEFAKSEDQMIKDQMQSFMDGLKNIFIEKLSTDKTKDKATIEQQANYLLLAKHGLAAASRVNTQKEIEDYISMIFKNI